MKISVCVAVYNGAKFIPTTFPTILEQLSEKDELIVVDDASTDNSVPIIRGFEAPNIRLFQNGQNQGVSKSFYRAIEQAKGDLITFADQDDFWLPEKAAFIRSYFHTQVTDLLVHNAQIVQNGSPLESTIFDINKSGTGFWKNFISDTFTGCCMVFRAAALQHIYPNFQDPKVLYDHYLGLMATLKKQSIEFVASPPLLLFNRHDSNLTHLNHRRSLAVVLKDRMRLLNMLWKNS